MLQLVACYLLYKAKILSILEMQKKIFYKYFFGRNQPLIQSLAEQFISENFDKLLYLPAVERLLLAQKEGHYTALLSSGPCFLVDIFAKRFQVDFYGSTQYEVHGGKFLKISKSMLGHEKAAYMLQLADTLKIDPSETIAYSDSIEDISLLKSAGQAVGVNPDLFLSKICKQNHWEII